LSLLILLPLFECGEASFELCAMLADAPAPLFEIAEVDDLSLIRIDQAALFTLERTELAFESKLFLLCGRAVTLILSKLILFDEQLRLT
jgi:hypothetical protein